MNDKEKINQIGKMVADISLEIQYLKRRQDKIYDFLVHPDKLEVEKEVNEIMNKNLTKHNSQKIQSAIEGKCKICGKNMTREDYVYGCSNCNAD